MLNRAINALPFELHVPGYQFCGPGTHLQKRLLRGDRGINPLDAACMSHDIAYSKHRDSEGRWEADRELAERAKQRIVAGDSTLGERAIATAVWAAMRAKTKLGMGTRGRRQVRNTHVRSKKKKKGTKRRKGGGKNRTTGGIKRRRMRVLPVAKRGGFIPLLLPALSAIGALTGGAAGVYKAVNDAKVARKQLEEAQRHNRAMEGRGLYLRPYASGRGLKNRRRSNRKNKKKKSQIKIKSVE